MDGGDVARLLAGGPERHDGRQVDLFDRHDNRWIDNWQ
jgi:hypothetical protein